MEKQKIDIHELAEWIADAEAKKTCSQIAEEMYKSRGKDFCTGLILHLTMYVSDCYGSKNIKVTKVTK